MTLSSGGKMDLGGIRRRVNQVLDVPEADDLINRVVSSALIILIILNVLAVIFESVATIRESAGNAFIWFEVFSVSVFTVEYVLRIWASVESADPVYRTPIY
tara:strand:+ start:199 stop:504 length:306 start_codon:yes stop_codon:yes gene_type:complete